MFQTDIVILSRFRLGYERDNQDFQNAKYFCLISDTSNCQAWCGGIGVGISNADMDRYEKRIGLLNANESIYNK